MIIREAKKEDTKIIIELIKELALYEKLEDEVKIDEEIFKEHIFKHKFARVLLAEYDEKIVGYALFFNTFSTFLGRGGVYLEDIYVKPEFRGLGIGLGMIKKLVEICKDNNLGRLEWECLDWNTKSIEFYENLGAKKHKGWIKFRLTKDEMVKIL